MQMLLELAGQWSEALTQHVLDVYVAAAAAVPDDRPPSAGDVLNACTSDAAARKVAGDNVGILPLVLYPLVKSKVLQKLAPQPAAPAAQPAPAAPAPAAQPAPAAAGVGCDGCRDRS